jgi:glycine/D-amino acid oxidase-like deaminating enzyme
VTLDRRRFLTIAGATALGAPLTSCAPALRTSRTGRAPDVAVIGAGAFGGWTAYHLRRMGASVTLVDTWGPGNSRSTSGDETRGVRSSYAERLSWVRWANEAIVRWTAWDEEHSARFGLRLFFPTSDLILRADWDPWLTESSRSWDTLGVAYEVLTLDEVQYRYPQISVDGMNVAVVERDAGVVRARRACEAVAEVFCGRGGRLTIARARPGARLGARLGDVALVPDDRLAAGAFVFACGPWLPKVLPDVMRNRLRTPLGHVYYFGTPPGDPRWTFPSCPSYNVPGVTGWPGLPPDNRGFRVRIGGRPPEDPDLSARWIDASYHERARTFLAERFPELRDAPILETRACHYESSVDRNFIVDRHPELENVWIAGGGSAEGFKFGPVIGGYIARRVLGEATDPALDEEFRLKPETFEELPPSAGDDAGLG